MNQKIIQINHFFDRHPNMASLFLRVGLAVVFLYAAISSFVSPSDWIGYLPTFVRSIFPATVVLGVFSVIELILAAWLLSGVYVRLAALICSIMLLGIVLSNFSLLPISFRDIGLIFAALALLFIPEPTKVR
jgi:uncharacterized membrane protein YphA (DoxX/SURF4 family)